MTTTTGGRCGSERLADRNSQRSRLTGCNDFLSVMATRQEQASPFGLQRLYGLQYCAIHQPAMTACTHTSVEVQGDDTMS